MNDDTADDARVTRATKVPAPIEAVWDAVTDARQLEAWLAPEVDLDIAPGATGRVVDDDGVERRAVVDDVEPGRRVALRWWPRDRPAEASRVVIELVPAVSHTVVTVTETRVVPVAQVSAGWTGRVLALAFVATARVHA